MPRLLPAFHPDDLQLPGVLARAVPCAGRSLLADAVTATAIEAELLRTCIRYGVAPLAYCVVPGGAQMVLVAASHPASSRALIGRWRQLTGRAYRARTGQTLWRARAVHEELADWPAVWAAVRRVIHEPVRAGLVARAADYRWVGMPPGVSGEGRSARPVPR